MWVICKKAVRGSTFISFLAVEMQLLSNTFAYAVATTHASHAAGLEASLSPSPQPLRCSREGGSAFSSAGHLTAELPRSPPITWSPASSDQNGPTPPPHARGSSSAEILQSARCARGLHQKLLLTRSTFHHKNGIVGNASICAHMRFGNPAAVVNGVARSPEFCRSSCSTAPCTLHRRSCEANSSGPESALLHFCLRLIPALLAYCSAYDTSGRLIFSRIYLLSD